MDYIITQDNLDAFQKELEAMGKSPVTIEKYSRDICKLCDYLQGRRLTQNVMDAYAVWLKEQGFKPSSIQSYLVITGVFCEMMHWDGIKVPVVKREKVTEKKEEDYLTAEEYRRLVRTAISKDNLRLAMLIQTVSGTDLRISELEYLTAQALRRGYVEVPRGGNMLRIFLPQGILEGLRDYMVRCGIWQGPVFLTASGKPVHRTNIWREIKALCRDAGVEERKVSIGSLKRRVRHQYYPVENT